MYWKKRELGLLCRPYKKINIWQNMLLIVFLLLIFFFDVYAQRDYEKEERIGARLAERVEKQYELIEDDEILQKVQDIADHLKEISGIYEINYRIKIIKQEGPNAFAFPGGFIYLTADLLDYVHSDHELAAVIAHEMGHVIHQHSIKQLQDKQKLKLVELLTLLITGDPTLGILSELTSITILNAYRREYEEEADLTSLKLLTKSPYYHPVGLLTYFERVKSEYLLKPDIQLGIFQTHPEVRERIKKIKNYFSENGMEINRRLTTNYLSVKGEYRQEGNIFIAEIFINNDSVLSFAGREEEALRLKMKEVVANLDQALRLDLEIYEVHLYPDQEERCSLRIGSEVIVTLYREEVTYQELTPFEVLKLTRDCLSRILWRLKLELPVLLVKE